MGHPTHFQIDIGDVAFVTPFSSPYVPSMHSCSYSCNYISLLYTLLNNLASRNAFGKLARSAKCMRMRRGSLAGAGELFGSWKRISVHLARSKNKVKTHFRGTYWRRSAKFAFCEQSLSAIKHAGNYRDYRVIRASGGKRAACALFSR